ncbi:MAG: YdeI/OmpD-associated family protein [Fimbriimonadaceae bacterium]|nr:DUF1905 domain-containing protein [Chthonomonadaceae bacterium]MCO5296580.1 YdeI/OmpD-associated family protein [Fimbriimonadaceae bacterium]
MAANPCITVHVTLLSDGATCAIPVGFDPKELFGKVRAPVKVTLNGFTFRSTIASMGGETFIPLRRSNREAAGLAGGESLDVRIELDTESRTVEPPRDLADALKTAPGAWTRWNELSFTHQRETVEAVEGAKRSETRALRIERAVKGLADEE